MNRSAITRAALRGRTARQGAAGVVVRFRGADITVTLTARDPDLTLAGGGHRREARWRIRMPGEIQPEPAEREQIVNLATAKIYTITGCIVAAGGRSQEHIVEAVEQ